MIAMERGKFYIGGNIHGELPPPYYGRMVVHVKLKPSSYSTSNPNLIPTAHRSQT
jgi:hypothetical protein